MHPLLSGKLMLKFTLSNAADYAIHVNCPTPPEGQAQWYKLRFSHLSRGLRTAIEEGFVRGGTGHSRHGVGLTAGQIQDKY